MSLFELKLKQRKWVLYNILNYITEISFLACSWLSTRRYYLDSHHRYITWNTMLNITGVKQYRRRCRQGNTIMVNWCKLQNVDNFNMVYLKCIYLCQCVSLIACINFQSQLRTSYNYFPVCTSKWLDCHDHFFYSIDLLKRRAL